jgi:Recombinase
MKQGKLVTHLAERRVIEAVLDMRRQNLSLRQIADFLTKIGVPTKKRGVKWHPEMVKRLLPSNDATLAERVIQRTEHTNGENCS